jgi:hypothetical protein
MPNTREASARKTKMRIREYNLSKFRINLGELNSEESRIP